MHSLFKKIELSLTQFTLMYSLITLLLFSFPFFESIHKVESNLIFMFLTACVVFLYFNTVFSLLFYRKTTKILAYVFLLLNAGVLYFEQTFHTYMDREMIRNVLETDSKETFELLSLTLIYYLIVFGGVPIYFLSKIKIKPAPFWKQRGRQFLNIFLSLFLVFIIFISFYKTISSFIRINKHLQYLLIPTNYITSSLDLGIKILKTEVNSTPPQPIALDAKIDSSFYDSIKQKNILVFVVGEAARAQNFSLNDYGRDTNSPLNSQDIIYFKNARSCGTATAISVPCMFSHFNRSDFSVDKEKGYQNITDILQKQNFSVFWRDNNSGCKGVCSRIPTKDYYAVVQDSPYCNKKECFDEIMLEGLAEKINQQKSKNIVVILHQKGSHGPAYFERIPDEFEKYKPACHSEYFEKCSQAEIVNAYDNTIYYTSHFLNKTIDFLKTKFKSDNTSLIYMSDHGQSLGEHGLYLHGAPYMIAPEEQTHIPAIVWLSKNFSSAFKIDVSCLKNKVDKEISHDYLFHSILGLFHIKTSLYEPDLDLFKTCMPSL